MAWLEVETKVVIDKDKVNDLRKRIQGIAKLEKKRSGLFGGLLDADSTEEKISLGGLGGGMLLAGTIALAGWRRREKRES